jgi:hypothetical protein
VVSVTFRAISRAVSLSGWEKLEATEESERMAGVVLARDDDIAMKPAMQQGQSEAAEGGEDVWGGPGMGGVGILAEDDIPDPMRAMFDPLMALPEAEHLGGTGLLGRSEVRP